ncbi:hypothetical protein AX16_009973 [Volvariella volvacea WC 439]|nr:hypothetical protein AX16_009973 [Volvariella volvacea WC 439]
MPPCQLAIYDEPDPEVDVGIDDEDKPALHGGHSHASNVPEDIWQSEDNLDTDEEKSEIQQDAIEKITYFNDYSPDCMDADFCQLLKMPPATVYEV